MWRWARIGAVERISLRARKGVQKDVPRWYVTSRANQEKLRTEDKRACLARPRPLALGQACLAQPPPAGCTGGAPRQLPGRRTRLPGSALLCGHTLLCLPGAEECKLGGSDAWQQTATASGAPRYPGRGAARCACRRRGKERSWLQKLFFGFADHSHMAQRLNVKALHESTGPWFFNNLTFSFSLV